MEWYFKKKKKLINKSKVCLYILFDKTIVKRNGRDYDKYITIVQWNVLKVLTIRIQFIKTLYS